MSINKSAEHKPKHSRGRWSGKLGFIMAAAGSAVGLGNIWKFPYVAGMHGGGAFVLFYILCILLIGTPLLMAEMMIGRRARKDPVGAFGKNSFWQLAGWIGVIAAFVILSYYCVIAGWTTSYLWQSISTLSAGHDSQQASQMFSILLGSGSAQIFWQALFMLATISTVICGVKGGVERASKLMMPVLFLLLVALATHGLFSQGGAKAVSFLFSPDWSKLTPPAMLEALGQAFFSLSLGMGAMLTFGSYADDKTDLQEVAFTVSVMDTIVALLAGLAIFPIVFTYSMEPAAGPGLVFQTLPVLFSQMPGGGLLSVMFFMLLMFAAFTSAISLLEVVVAYYCDELEWQRSKATLVAGLMAFLVGVPSALSDNLLKEWHLIGGRNFLDTVDFLATNYLLPLGGLLIALFAGWMLKSEDSQAELTKGGGSLRIYRIWLFLIRYISPVLVALVLLSKIGLF